MHLLDHDLQKVRQLLLNQPISTPQGYSTVQARLQRILCNTMVSGDWNMPIF